MRVNVFPGDLLVATSSHLGDHGTPAQIVRIDRGDTLLVVGSTPAAPVATFSDYDDRIESLDLLDLVEGHYPDRYYVTAIWHNILIETIITADKPPFNVFRRGS